ncbi:conserved hypothetical protein [Leptospira interrogans serovar Manilae]|uniref:Uncharacterized protein n=1 Tax=Leptospira interrogans serovar Manilae TaxID=214675 RepID=A0AAQ1P2U4_LEPIR|nr:hypothetical protein [Leptospira interrogans]AKP25943.1 hypothetical protein LIMLP_08310 [Leptospira interrogans serovar Manilae]AKP29728.1 hypothetical protein LIMHP_08305 [Leptospira interrogans serovar Manilae]EYU62491.1 hypothetical protein CI00_20115 [Leptospira interrogans serovar Manilae]SOR63393.1 conserved hypothetical protein [Leptospira interrogans serovar Manilae]
MTFRYTLEGDQATELPNDAVLLRVKGKYIPTHDLGDNILNGDFYVEELDYHSPSRGQLSGEENSVIPVRLGTLYHDDAMPIALSGDELGMFGMAKLFGRGFKLPSLGRLPSFRGLRINTSGISKGFKSATKSIQKAGKDVLKTGQKAVKDYGKTLQKGVKDVGKFAGKALEAVPDVLQAVGQGQGAPEGGEEEEQQPEEIDESGQVSEESFSEENPAYDESGYGDSLNGELGFFQAAMAAAPMVTNVLSQFSNIQNQKTQVKSQARANTINSLAQLVRPTSVNRAPAKKAVAPAQNKNFSNPALSKTSEGKYALTYSSSRGGEGEGPPAPNPNGNADKKDDKMLLYAGGGLAAIIVLVVVMNNMKGKK